MTNLNFSPTHLTKYSKQTKYNYMKAYVMKWCDAHIFYLIIEVGIPKKRNIDVTVIFSCVDNDILKK